MTRAVPLVRRSFDAVAFGEFRESHPRANPDDEAMAQQLAEDLNGSRKQSEGVITREATSATIGPRAVIDPDEPAISDPPKKANKIRRRGASKRPSRDVSRPAS